MEKIASCLRSIGGNVKHAGQIVRETYVGNGLVYELTFLGIFLTKNGKSYEKWFAQLIEFLRDKFYRKKEGDSDSFDDVTIGKTLKLNDAERFEFGQLLKFASPYQSHGHTVGRTWSITTPITEIQKLSKTEPVRKYCEKLILQNFKYETWVYQDDRPIQNVPLPVFAAVTNNPLEETTSPKSKKEPSAKTFSDRWTITDNLPEGGQAHVFKVIDKKGGGKTEYVLKRLKNPHRLDRFKKEYEALRKLRHPAIVRLIDFDFDTKKPFFVTEFCELGSLADQEKILLEPISVKVEKFLEICRGLQVAHENGIIHRDIKPENIFIRKDGSVALGDFGLCHDQAIEARLTATKEQIGSRFFIPPEYEDGQVQEVNSLGDIYSLGKLLYWLLSGGKKFAREKFREPEYDLRNFISVGDPYIDQLVERFNAVLDKMITVRPDNRIPIKEVLQKVQRAERLWTLEYALPSSDKGGALCRYCGEGDYVPCKDSPVNFGIEQRGQQNLKILVCNCCGHVELFRPDHIDLYPL